MPPATTARHAGPFHKIAEPPGTCLRDFSLSTRHSALNLSQSDEARVVIPMHTGRELKRKTLRGIIQDLKITVEEFRNLL